MMQINIPELAVIVIIGKKHNEKNAFLKKYFDKEEIIDEEIVEEQLEKRLEEAKLTVIDLRDLDNNAYQEILRIAKRQHCMPVAISFNPEGIQTDLINKKDGQEKISSGDLIEELEKKGFKKVYILKDLREIRKARVQRIKLANNKRKIRGPFDIIGDVHGCYDELCELLEKLGYIVNQEQDIVYAPHQRKVIFLGDLVDRGPKIVKVLKLVMNMVKKGQAYCVLGNHDGKLQRKLRGSNVQVAYGLEKTVEELEREPEEFIQEVRQFLDHLVSHYVFDEGKLVVAHAGLKEKLHGRESAKIREIAMFGPTTGKVDEHGLPIRVNWSEQYKGNAMVVYGHTPQVMPRIVNNTINIDTGCVYGGRLTAFRYPEQEIVDVQAKAIYYEAARPFV